MRYFILFIISSLSFCITANAQDVYLMTRSYHTDRSKDYVEWNPGIGIRDSIKSYDVEFGAYRNSLNKFSTYSIGLKTWYLREYFSVSLGGGFLTGYEDLVTPFMVGSISIGDPHGIRIGFIPDPSNTSLFFLQIKISL